VIGHGYRAKHTADKQETQRGDDYTAPKQPSRRGIVVMTGLLQHASPVVVHPAASGSGAQE
jgi:hypothetical protein